MMEDIGVNFHLNSKENSILNAYNRIIITSHGATMWEEIIIGIIVQIALMIIKPSWINKNELWNNPI